MSCSSSGVTIVSLALGVLLLLLYSNWEVVGKCVLPIDEEVEIDFGVGLG